MRFPLPVRTQHVAAVLLLCCLGGCAAQENVRSERYFWPPPPSPPRIEWLAAYHSQLDLDKTMFRRIKEAIVGEDAPIALIKPVDVKVDAAHNKMYVADLIAAGVYVFDFAERDFRRLRVPEKDFNGPLQPVGLALDREDNLYLLDVRHKRILVFDSAENYRREIKLDLFCPRPIALAIDKVKGRLYVADAKESAIFALDMSGTQLFVIGGSGNDSGRLNRPVGMVVNSKGELVVADAFNARVQIFDQQGKYQRSIGERGSGDSDFQLIKAAAVDHDDNIYVVDGRSNSIKIFNNAGEFLLSFGNYYAVSTSGKQAPGGFALPIGIDIDGNGRIFIVDQLNARVQVFQYLPDEGERSGVRP